MARHIPSSSTSPSSGIKVIVVGLGLAGLSTAIECHRKGHSVILLERITQLKHDAGDGIAIGPNAVRIIRQWGSEVVAEIDRTRCDATHADMMDHCDKFIARNELPGKGQQFVTNRAKLVSIFYEHAKGLGIDIRFGAQVTEYWETSNEAGVIVNGEDRLAANCVVCADGVNGMSRQFITGEKIDRTRKETGWATFRAHIDTNSEPFASDPEAQWVLKGTGEQDQAYAWFGEGVNMAMLTMGRGKDLVWMTTHWDCYGAQETWSGGGVHAKLADAMAAIDHWPGKERIRAVIRHTQPSKLVNHPLVYRPPLKTWISPGGRAILIGDAAHPYFPVVGQGGSQGMEDGAVIAVTLALAGKDQVPLGLRAAERIRYPRASVIQLGSSALQEALLRPDWETVAKDPDLFRFPNPDWVFNHDCQEYTHLVFETVVQAIQTGSDYIPSNIPVDGVYRVENTYNVEA
ncbi:hypothetical protein Asppvi_001731 [Aspergillus pseudoviridinutans]|uniref:FAD-binding domain-containing protein n=1 Tax=Aspergillus pseudoviridinutans TaxID=1517512 RepID=A0A9P3B8P0_9EURO|nr:uncharacterized protein Asppvi_001731 [Aspergillus pseudoviridinutans]GIJ83211.1 hypothetical protein Asppvi_001731 [Aspergillus pseudoviridinutans]